MKLIDFKDFFGVAVDGEFDSLCNVTSETDVRCLSFAGNERYIKEALKKKNISCLVVPFGMENLDDIKKKDIGVAVSKTPKTAFHRLHNFLANTENSNYVSEVKSTVIGENCKIHKSASISENNVIIGNNVVIEENVIIREGVTIGDNTVIMAGAYVGYSDCLAGTDENGNLLPLLSAGEVRLGKNVCIGAYSVVSKGLFPYEATEICDNSMAGYAVDLSHNSRVGRNTIILDQSQICGNTIIGDNVRVSPQAIVSNRLRIEEGAEVAIGSVVVNNIKKGVRVAGNYAIENSKFLLWHRKKLREK